MDPEIQQMVSTHKQHLTLLFQWYHLDVTRSTDTIKIFINGVMSGTQIVPNLFIPNPAAPLTIGQAENIGYMNGKLDEMTIYKRALSNQEILDIYNAGIAGKCKPMPTIPRNCSEILNKTLLHKWCLYHRPRWCRCIAFYELQLRYDYRWRWLDVGVKL
nr:LamG domain-containing protein [Bacteroidota bacterium]